MRRWKMFVRSCRSRATLAAASLFLASGLAVAAPLPLEPEVQQAAPDAALVNAALGLIDGQVVTLEIDSTYGVPVQVGVPMGGQDLLLDLWPHSVRSAEYQLLEDRGGGMLHEVDPGPINTLRGV